MPIFSGINETINTLTLDEFLLANNVQQQIKLIKIDVEGYELQVLLGAKATLERTQNLIIELSPLLMQEHGYSSQTIIDLLEEKGFKPYFFDNNKIVPTTKESLLKNSNVITMLWSCSELKDDGPPAILF